jgi:PAS domain S-box-containing protein
MVFDDGTIRSLLGNAVPLLDSMGQPQGAVGAFMDVTERKQAEDALKRAHNELEQRVRERTAELRDTVGQLIEEVQERQQAQESLRKQAELLELAHEAIMVQDLDSRVTFWNRGAAETYGWAREQALSQVADVLLQTQFPTTREEVDQALLQTGQWQGELVHTRADGEKIVVASRMALQRDDQGQPVAILEINRDVTARRQAEEALKIEQQRLFAVLERIPAHVALLRPDHTLAYANGEFIRRFGEPGTKRCYELKEQQNPCAECQAMEVFHTEKPVVWEWTGADGNVYQMYDYPFIDVDGSPLVLEMGVDLTPRKRAEEQAFSLGRMYRMLSKVNEAIVRVPNDKDELFRQICRIMMEEGDFLLSWIGLVDPETRLVKGAAHYDLNDDYLQNLTIPIDDVPEGRGPTGIAVREGRYDVCNDIATDPRMAPWREPALARGFRSSAAFPLRVGAQVVGALTVYANRPGFFTADETDLLESLADDLSFALDFMDREDKRRQAEEALRESEERLRYLASRLLHAQENERHRLALELHDDLGQSLMVLKLQLRAIEKTVPADQWQTRNECVHSLNYLNGVIHNVRRLARNLRPSVLEDLGLSAGLRVLTEEFRDYHEMDISLEMDEIEGLFSQDEEINIYRIFQETLTNIAKHAQARRVNLAIRRQADSVTFKAVDDGVGFDLEQVLARDPAKKGLGLAALEERVHMLGGTQIIRTQAHQGTEVSFIVPLTQNRLTE